MLTETELAEIEARERAATPGPWVYFDQEGVFCGEIHSAREDGGFEHITDTPEYDERDNDMKFIAHARTDIPSLIAMIRELQREQA